MLPVAGWVLKLILDTVAPCYRDPRPTRSVWRFADEEVWLDSKASPRPGRYRSIETPWTRDFQDTFIDPRYDEDLAMKSSRTGFTEAGLNIVRYMPEHAPGNVLITQDTRDSAKNVSKGRLASTLSAAAGANMSDDPDDDGTFVKFLRNMIVWITGSYSAGTFREKWLRLALLDEVEVNPEIPGEGFLLDLAVTRFTGVDGAKLLAMSKPRRWGSLFHKRVATGTCEVYLVECPHCRTWQELTFDGESATATLHIDDDGTGQRLTGTLAAKPAPLGRLMFEHCRDLLGQYDKGRVAREAYYQCVSGCRIDDVDRTGGPRSPFGPGRWLITNPSPFPRRRSRHISDLYSPYRETSFGQLALKWIDCADQVARDHFKNNHLGLPARDEAVAIKERNVLDCRSAYARGSCPFEPDLVLLTWDTQDDRLEWGITAWRVTGRDLGECAVIDFGKIFHPDELLLLVGEKFATPSGAEVSPLVGLGDAGGHRSAEIYEVCLKSAGRLFPSYGGGSVRAGYSPLRETAFKHGQREVTGYLFSDGNYKRRLYLDTINKIEETITAHGRDLSRPHPRLHLPADILDTKEGAEFVTGLTKERTSERSTRRGMVVEWDENIRGNEAGDIVKLAYVAFDFMRPGLDREKAKRDAAAAAEKAKAA